jgi:endonuclease/exonuclease/phosphatase family metal-dependent hydrolase
MSKQSITVMQYNAFLRNEVPYLANLYDGQNVRLQDIPNALHKINSNIDIIVFNELFHKNKNVLFESLESVWKHRTKVIKSITSFETSGVFIMTKTPILDEQEIIFKNAKNWDYLASKGVKYIKTNIGGCVTHIFATHMQATYNLEYDVYSKIRKKQLKQLKKFIESISIGQKELVVVCGDFNIRYNSEEYKHMEKYLNIDQYTYISDKKSTNTSNQLHGLSHEARQNGCHEEYRKNHVCKCCPNELVDFVFVLKGFKKTKSISLDVWTSFKPTKKLCGYVYNRLDKTDQDTCPKNTVRIRDLSDHFPVIVVIQI